MKTIIYIATAIMISGILFSAVPFDKTGKNTCIRIQCTDAVINESLLEESAKIIENRLKDAGLKTSQISIAEGGIIEICFKNEDALNKVKDLVSMKGRFEFYETLDRNEVLKNIKKDDQLFSDLNIPVANDEQLNIPNSVLGYYGEHTCSESIEFTESLNKGFGEDIKFAMSKFEDKEKNKSLYILKPKSYLGGNSITDVSSDKDKETGANFILMNFNEEGSKKWAEITRNNIGKEIAMVFDDLVYSAPMVMAEIKGGKAMITGNFSKDEASVLCAMIKFGELPLDFKIIK